MSATGPAHTRYADWDFGNAAGLNLLAAELQFFDAHLRDIDDGYSDLPAVRALLARALELDADYNRGAVHGALIILESLPVEVGGSPQRAREHFDRAVELSDGLDASPYVSYATGVLQPSEERAEWERLLRLALAVDPDEDTSLRLLNLINQRRAQSLLDHADELFFVPANTEEVRP